MSVTLIDPYKFVGFDSDYELITTTVLTTDTASVTFSNLGDYSSTYKHLQVRYAARSARAVSATTTVMRFNSDTGSNYRSHNLFGNGSSVISDTTSATYMLAGITFGASATANAFNGAVVDILDPYSSSKNTTIRTLAGISSSFVTFTSAFWNNTASITSITLLDESLSSNLVTGSRFSLYGIK
jgi:hypothetical protein